MPGGFNRKVKYAFALALLALIVAAPVPGQQAGITRRVEFPPGRSSIVITGEVPLGKKDTYIFRVRNGQFISGDVLWKGERVGGDDDPGLSGFIFIEPDGTSHTNPQDFYFQAKATGDYRVVVRPPYKMTGYRYRFELAIGKNSYQTEADLKPAGNSTRAQRLEKYVGKYPRELFKNEPAVTKRLRALLGQHYELFELNMVVQSPIKLDEGVLVMEGNAPHAGGVEDAYLAITLSDGKLRCAIRSNDFGGKVKTFSEDPKNMPPFIKRLIDGSTDPERTQNENSENAVHFSGDIWSLAGADSGLLKLEKVSALFIERTRSCANQDLRPGSVQGLCSE